MKSRADLPSVVMADIEQDPFRVRYRLCGSGNSGRHPVQTGIWPLANDGRNVDMCIAVEDDPKLRRAELEPSTVLQAF